jgi:RNA polymerase sigma-70 factor (ECF subfamily)
MQVAVTNSTTISGAGPTDAALVVAARAEETWAKEALFRRYIAMVNGLGYRLLGRDSDLEDLVQDSFTEAWRALPGLENPQAFASWMASIVVRTAHKMLRRRRLARALGLRRSDPVDFDALIAPTAPPDARSEIEGIYRVVERLPAATRVAFLLRRVEGLPLQEIADCMGTSLATVKRRIASAEQSLTGENPHKWSES